MCQPAAGHSLPLGGRDTLAVADADTCRLRRSFGTRASVSSMKVFRVTWPDGSLQLRSRSSVPGYPTGALLRRCAIMSADECGQEHSTFRSVAARSYRLHFVPLSVPAPRRYSCTVLLYLSLFYFFYPLPIPRSCCGRWGIRTCYPTPGPGLRAARSALTRARFAITCADVSGPPPCAFRSVAGTPCPSVLYSPGSCGVQAFRAACPRC